MSVLDKLSAAEPLTDAEILALLSAPDILSLGMLADEVRRARHGSKTTFVRVAEIDVAAAGEPDWPEAAGEVRLTGDLGDVEAAASAVGRVAGRAAGQLPVSGFSLAAIERAAGGETGAMRDLASRLRDAGLDLVAEAPIDDLVDAERAVEAVTAVGLPVLRLTVAQVTGDARVGMLGRAAALCRTAGGIQAFAPLPLRSSAEAPSTGYDDVRFVALARLVVRDVPSIQVDWRRYGPKLAQVALTVGADDVDGVSPLDEGTEGRRRAPLAEILRNITAAGLRPVERDGRFRARG